MTLEEIRTAVFGLIAEARQGAGEDVPLTSLEREVAGRGTLPTFVTNVRAVAELTPNLRQVVIGGPELAHIRLVGGDQFFYVLVTRPGDEPLPDGYAMADWMAADEATRPYGAYYTVRHWNPERAEITLWAVVHGHAAGVGGWFAHCAPGDRLAIWGPRHGFWSDGVYAPTTGARHHLFVTDESGFAAVAALLDLLPAADSATVLAETADPDHAITFPRRRTNVRWSYPRHRGAGRRRGAARHGPPTRWRQRRSARHRVRGWRVAPDHGDPPVPPARGRPAGDGGVDDRLLAPRIGVHFPNGRSGHPRSRPRYREPR